MTNNKKPYSRISKTISKKDSSSKNKKKKINTNKKEESPQVRLDKERINDIETLDTSFLEGRISKKKTKAVKEKLLMEKKDNKKIYLKYFYIIVFTLLVVLCIYFMIIGFNKYTNNKTNKNNNIDKTESNSTIKVDIDNNYLFIGTFNTNKLDFGDDYHYIKISEDYYNTNHILDEIDKKIYQYNPTYVFIELGINELYIESNEDFILRLSKIIDGIKENRPYAKIYVESIYPINRNVINFDNSIIKDYIDNDLIYKVNKDIKKMTIEKDIKYLDLYSLLIDNGNLIEEYTDNGVYLNNRGYMVVYDEINNILG